VNASVSQDAQPELRNWPIETIYQSLLDRSEAHQAAGARNCKAYRSINCDFKFIIATVPDPVNSHYPVVFDRLVESIQRGFNRYHYTLDRFWLPWEAEPGPVDSDYVMHERHKEWLEAVQEYPGVLVFRPEGTSLERICVLLVGENPVTGIHKLEFMNAMDTIEYFAPTPEISVLGPTYSGSITSLGLAMAMTSQSFRVATGTVTDDQTYSKLVKVAGGKKITFQHFNGWDKTALGMFLNYARNKASIEHIAVLSESGTSYGQDIAEQAKGSKILHFSYPMEISRLRNAYGNDPELEALQAATGDAQPRQGLQIQMKDEHESEDNIPTFSTELRPVAQEAAVLSVMAAIARSQVEYVGIVASDILDSVFLGRLLKQHCPNTRAFILDADLIYGHVSQNNAFDGMLMATTYPLFHSPVEADAPQFSSAVEEGEYWATISLIPGVMPDPVNTKAVNTKPWLAVVGRDGIWPIREPEGNPGPLTRLSTSLGWTVGFTLATLFCLAFSGAVFYFNWNNKGEDLSIGWLSALKVSPQNKLSSQIALTIACLLLAGIYGFAALLQLQYESSLASFTPALVCGIAACALTPTALLGALICCWEPRPWVYAVAPVVSVVGCLVAYHPLPDRWSPFVYRALHVSNGVSPIVPLGLIMAALFWLAWTHLNRLRLLHLFPDEFPKFDEDVFLTGTQTLLTNLKSIFGHWATGSYKWTVSVGVVLLFSLLIIRPNHIFSLETFHFEWLFTAALYGLYLGLLIECTRFVRGWSALQEMLHMLERHAICEAFCRLPNELSPSLLWRWGGGSQSFLVLAHFLKKFATLTEDKDRSVFTDSAPRHDEEFGELAAAVRKLINFNNCAQYIPAATLTELNQKVGKVFSRLANSLSHHWGTVSLQQPATLAAAAGGGTPRIVRVSPLSTANQALAEEIVALRFVDLIALVNMQLKHSLEFIAGGLILAIIALNSYPFEPHHTMTSMVTIYFFAMSAVFLTVFIQMNRNTIISYLSDTTPGKLDGNLFHVLSFGGLPLLAVVSSQFPSIGNFLFAWVKPALETLR
jgi:hypothetical protein